VPKSKAKTKKGIQRAIHKEAKHLKSKGPWKHLTWREAHGVAKRIVTGSGKSKGKKSGKKKRR
jgi:hypothetical protein